MAALAAIDRVLLKSTPGHVLCKIFLWTIEKHEKDGIGRNPYAIQPVVIYEHFLHILVFKCLFMVAFAVLHNIIRPVVNVYIGDIRYGSI